MDAKELFVSMIKILLLILCCVILVIATHPPSCSDGKTPLQLAIDENHDDVVALLRSVGAQE